MTTVEELKRVLEERKLIDALDPELIKRLAEFSEPKIDVEDEVKKKANLADVIADRVAALEKDDPQNSIRNATRCLEGHGYLELQNMVANYYYRSGQNQMINEIREILGLEKLYMPGERARIKAQQASNDERSPEVWNCPELEDWEIVGSKGSAKLIPIGEDGSLLVIGTKSVVIAASLIRSYQRNEWGLDTDELAKADELNKVKVVWKVPSKDDEDHDCSHIFNWSEVTTKHNPKAVTGFMLQY